MAYTTKAAEEIIDHLEIAAARYDETFRKLDDVTRPEYHTRDESHDRGLWAGYRDGTQIVIDYLKRHLETVEAEARLVPEVEEDAAEWLRKQMSDFPSMAGDYRDFPADHAA